MRKMFALKLNASGRNRIELEAAEVRSRPKGFSMITRAAAGTVSFVSCSTTGPNITGGIAR